MTKHTTTTKPDTTEPAASAAEQANLKPGPDGQPDPAGQAKISAAGGQRGRGDLVTELGALPPIAALDGVRANAKAGYYATVPTADLVADLEGVTFEDEEHAKVRDALVERVKGGAFSKPSQG
jgi:hypothetical protein